MEEQFDYEKETFLVVDDETGLGDLVRDILSNLGFKARSVTSGENALQELRNERYTFLITDINMPELDGIELIRMVKKEGTDINIIAMTGYDKDYTYMDVIHAGANDFIAKPFKSDEIEAKIKRILIEKKTRDDLRKASITDSLTGLYNQRHFFHRMEEEIDRANRQKRSLSLILLDLDKFKDYNDQYGHLAGDKVLSKSGKTILSSIRENVDLAFRYGGDEFAVILVEADNAIAQDICQRLRHGFEVGGGVTASAGLATYSKDMSVNDFVGLADKNLYQAKKRILKIVGD